MINTNYEIQQEPSVGEALKDFEKSAITLLSSILSGNFKSKKTNEATVKKEADLCSDHSNLWSGLRNRSDLYSWPSRMAARQVS